MRITTLLLLLSVGILAGPSLAWSQAGPNATVVSCAQMISLDRCAHSLAGHAPRCSGKEQAFCYPGAWIHSSLATVTRADVLPITHAEVLRPSHWKTGAVIGGVLGAGTGGLVGFAMDNVINEGNWSVGKGTIGGTLLGATAGALLGAGVNWFISR